MPCSFIERLNNVKMTILILPKLIYRFNTIPIKISIISVEIDRLILKL